MDGGKIIALDTPQSPRRPAPRPRLHQGSASSGWRTSRTSSSTSPATSCARRTDRWARGSACGGPLRGQREDVHPQPDGGLLQPLPAADHHADLRRPELRGVDRPRRSAWSTRPSTDASAALIDALRRVRLPRDHHAATREAELAALEDGRSGLRARHPGRLAPTLGGETGLVGYAVTADPAPGAGGARALLQQAVAGALAASGQRAAAGRFTRAGGLRVGRVARPRLHRLPGAGHRRHDVMQLGIFGVAFGFVQLKRTGALRRLFATPTSPSYFLSAQVSSPHGARLRPGRHPHRHRHLVRAADVRLVARPGAHRRAGAR